MHLLLARNGILSSPPSNMIWVKNYCQKSWCLGYILHLAIILYASDNRITEIINCCAYLLLRCTFFADHCIIYSLFACVWVCISLVPGWKSILWHNFLFLARFMKLNSILFLQKGHQYLLKNAYVENAHKIDHVIIEKMGA